MPKATAVFDADDSRLSDALARINGKMRALQSRLARFAVALIGGSRSIRSSFGLNAKHWSRRKLADRLRRHEQSERAGWRRLEPEARIVCGGGNSTGRKTASLPITLQFTRDIKGLCDERTGKERGNRREFVFDWKQNEAVVVSFDSR